MKKNSIFKVQKDAWDIFLRGLHAVDPFSAIERNVKLTGSILEIEGQKYDLDNYKQVIVVGAGKAGATMSRAIEDILGDRISFGHVNVKYGHVDTVNTINIHEAAHPVPDQAGYDGAQIIYDILKKTGEDDLIIFLLSGGGSALMPLPAEGISLVEKQQVTNLLLSCGATINEINTIRKHISRFKGGYLAGVAYPSTLITLIISDVIGDPLDTIASGPTVADNSTFDDCLRILKKYDIIAEAPGSITRHINLGVAGVAKETPKKGDPIFSKIQNVIVANNMNAFKAGKKKAIELGYTPLILSTLIEGETKDVAKVHAAIAKEIRKSGNPIAPPACILSGGETTVTIKGNGLGGRNQEFALAVAIEIEGMENTVIASIATDGTDGPTNPAGAIADGSTIERGKKLGVSAVEYLDNNDSYHFFHKIGDLLISGPTNTNVMDFRIILVV